jgi:hypothetical protein
VAAAVKSYLRNAIVQFSLAARTSMQPMSFGLQQPLSVPFGSAYPSVVVPIDGIFNNQAASKNGAIANFDGHGSSFDVRYLPHGSWVYDGITVRGSYPTSISIQHSPQLPSTTFHHLGVSDPTMCWQTTRSFIYPNRRSFTNCIFCMLGMGLKVWFWS